MIALAVVLYLLPRNRGILDIRPRLHPRVVLDLSRVPRHRHLVAMTDTIARVGVRAGVEARVKAGVAIGARVPCEAAPRQVYVYLHLRFPQPQPFL